MTLSYGVQFGRRLGHKIVAEKKLGGFCELIRLYKHERKL